MESGSPGVNLQARAVILEPQHPFFVVDRAVPRSGVTVQRYFRFTRGADGAHYLWLARKSEVGAGSGWSGLRFDVVRDMSQAA
jgi:hypothetical protein